MLFFFNDNRWGTMTIYLLTRRKSKHRPKNIADSLGDDWYTFLVWPVFKNESWMDRDHECFRIIYVQNCVHFLFPAFQISYPQSMKYMNKVYFNFCLHWSGGPKKGGAESPVARFYREGDWSGKVKKKNLAVLLKAFHSLMTSVGSRSELQRQLPLASK